MSERGKFSCVLIGEQSFLIPYAELILKKGHRIQGIITTDPDTLKWAEEKNTPCIDPASDLVGQLEKEPFDILFSIANFTIIPEDLLALPRKYAINFHGGILPDCAGMNVPAWALINRATEHGVSWHIMTAELDKGAILKQKRFPVTEGETSLTLNLKCYEAGIQSFGEMMDELTEDRGQPTRQDFSRRTYFGKWKRPYAACMIDWTRSSNEIDAMVRAFNYGPYWNPLGMAKMLVDDRALIVKRTKILPEKATAPSGTITKIENGEIHVSTGTQGVALLEFVGLDGETMSPSQVVESFGLKQGDILTTLETHRADALTKVYSKYCRQEQFWIKRLSGLDLIEIPYAKRQNSEKGHDSYRELFLSTPAPVLNFEGVKGSPGDLLLSAFNLYLSRTVGKEAFSIPFCESSMSKEIGLIEGLFASHIPLYVYLEDNPKFGDFQTRMQEELNTLKKKGSYAMDLIVRHPDLGPAVYQWHSEPFPVAIERVSKITPQKPKTWVPSSESDLTIVIPDDGRQCLWVYNPSVFDDKAIRRMQAQFEALLNEIAKTPNALVSEFSILSDQEKKDLLENWNSTDLEYPKDVCIHHLFEEQVKKTPDAVALAFQEESLTYKELNHRTNQIAHYLMERNVGPDDMVAVLLDPSMDVQVVLGIMKAGGAYLHLDPTYPKERLAFLVEDAQVSIVVTQEKYSKLLPGTGAEIIQIDSESAQIARSGSENPTGNVNSHNLAYVIYTSGSTGKPKGVMIEHRNVINFFSGMDQCLVGDRPGVWLAVTSLSFDISVLELFWTLARGFKVVLYSGDDRAIGAGTEKETEKQLTHSDKKIDFSLFYFSSDEGENGNNKYRLLLEGAKYGDEHGFSAVWTPERHFHAFGGLFPSPATVSAAIAVLTKNVSIRAGSCVLPLHNPIRIAEDWALVDNLSNGRVGISFASGWHPNDFVFQPENFAERHKKMSEGIEQVRALWRGETLSLPGPLNEDVKVRTLPRPIQPELPFWVTAAGNPDTFRKAGKAGANMLTHLLGQSVEEVAEKIQVYRNAWKEAGHPGAGIVSLMLHTFIADDEEFVRAQVKEPLKEYLRTAGGLIQKYASSFFLPFKGMSDDDKKSIDEQFQKMTDEDREAMLEHAYLRYYETSGLFGTPESCIALVDRLKGIGVDDIACLIDFGVPSETVLKHLPYLNELRKSTSTPKNADAKADYSIPALIHRHKVTHLQCTPSMAGMLTADEQAHDALRTLKHMMVGGEAFPTKLASELLSLVPGQVINMYGPTETTIWSSTHVLDDSPGAIPIGRPIANTQLYVLGKNLQPVPVGVPGELFIAGDGVVRGYLYRPELTEERFVPDPFSDDPQARMYRTGDLVRYRPDGVLEFLGRMDHQVKIMGYRLELGEIESVLSRHVQVKEAVVIAREDSTGNKQLVGYVIPSHGKHPPVESLRSYLRERLPEYMVPSAFMVLDSFPLTPNKKVDRKALPAPEQTRHLAKDEIFKPKTHAEKELLEIWKETLAIQEVGAHDSFFDLGGHSLSAIGVAMRIQQTFGVDFPMRLVFQAPTLIELAVKIDEMVLEQADNQELDALLNEIEQLPDHENGLVRNSSGQN
jgi:natural product biosynthesis luciferase-like monooxygenase protein